MGYIHHSRLQQGLGYPAQKPEALLERIVMASRNEGDTVLDPFCGCGPAVVAAQKLKRQWIGIDITHLAITHRLQSTLGEQVAGEYWVVGEPVSLPDAQALAASDPYQFQWWALGLVGARCPRLRRFVVLQRSRAWSRMSSLLPVVRTPVRTGGDYLFGGARRNASLSSWITRTFTAAPAASSTRAMREPSPDRLTRLPSAN